MKIKQGRREHNNVRITQVLEGKVDFKILENIPYFNSKYPANNMYEIKGKVALIAGGLGGIALAIVRAFLKEGAKVSSEIKAQ